ncbi:MAG: ribose-phosphate pyrophosphokinase [Candidatus Blackburnbacteria bacterium]|nr:ribose-phosphate pyrophosphokinase [Candidatus Blackburnbacteria bacterium]
MPKHNDLVLLTGTANLPLAKDIGKRLKKTVHETVSEFADGEKRIIIPENLRRRDVFIIQPTSPPTDSNIMELLLMIDAARRASATEITAITPYFGYSRQDRKEARAAISASLVASLIEHAGANRIVTIDMHSEQSQGSIQSPWDNLYASFSLVPAIKSKFHSNLIVASPDKGGVSKATYYAERLRADGIAIVYKERDIKKKNHSKVLDMIGEVGGKDVLLVDDMIDTAGTICGAADLLKKRGARSIRAAATHGLFSKPAIARIAKSPIQEIFITDTVELKNEVVKNPKINVISVGKLLAEAIRCIHTGDSLSAKFNR